MNFEMLISSRNQTTCRSEKYLRCTLYGSLSGESMALNVIDKVNSHFKFLHRENCFLPLF